MHAARATAVEVALRGLTKQFGRSFSVRDLTLVIARGEFFTLLGPSGCGKTTTLRMIAGLLPPDAGEIAFDGRPVTTTPAWQRNIGMVFQNYALWPHMSIFDNVAFGLVERRTPRAETRRRVDDALALVGLEGMGGRLPSQLSGGQQQRVALARAIVVEPALLLLDEPLSNLDARLRVQMRNELARLQRQLGITTIYVTHDQEEALMLSTRIAVMHQGRLEQLGAPHEVYERPASAFVADFFGGTNFLDGTVQKATAHEIIVALEGGATLFADAGRNPGVVAGETVTVCLRPEVLRVDAAPVPSAGAAGTLSGTLRLRTYLGWAVSDEIVLASGAIVRAQGAARRDGERLSSGDRVTVTVAPEDVLLLRRGR
jgi:ABC-type Fe3+/spermidine/putrescine transport system ATPase subunit